MNGNETPQCPRTELLSALMDGEVTGASRTEITAHAGTCPLCGEMLRDLGELRSALRPLAAARAGIDLAPLIEQRLTAREQRLTARERPHRAARGRSWWHGWQILPSGLAAAGVLATGVYLGALLTGAAGATVMRPAAMAMFDAVPPGGLCVGMSLCYRLGR